MNRGLIVTGTSCSVAKKSHDYWRKTSTYSHFSNDWYPLIPCVWLIWLVHPKILTGECSWTWNYMKKLYSSTWNYMNKLYKIIQCPNILFQPHCPVSFSDCTVARVKSLKHTGLVSLFTGGISLWYPLTFRWWRHRLNRTHSSRTNEHNYDVGLDWL